MDLRSGLVTKITAGPNFFDLIYLLRSSLSINRLELLLRRNQLRATRGRVESHRTVPVDGPLNSPASQRQLSVSAAS